MFKAGILAILIIVQSVHLLKLSDYLKGLLQKEDPTHDTCSAKSNCFLGWKSRETHPVLSGYKMNSSELDHPYLYQLPSRYYGKDLHKYNMYGSNKTLCL